ncbi:MAG: transcription-repair coupling factor, partial [Clostridia bacterium]|nr:transcription-repair coupling factor [Clostridia bacterium]
RFKNFPITIDYLCRFRTATQRKKVLERLAAGQIDILVGTHSLIKDKVTFKNLGLAIIDEEQRFGVLHKDRFKQQHPEVDMLSLSATPIPRTLHMSLSGIRDISVLEDPPQDRLPVQTYVAEWDPALIRNGIYREMARKGQVFYLYNRVQTMGEKLLALRNLVPEARIAMAHGQMGERELEDIMQAFYQGEYDVLLCTTIIESGLDMPNVNTIIVEDSDRMGLAQLYQIRGRVGRASKLAYAYITYKKDKNLSEIAEKRLRTIREFTEFGSGFKIALRDLEIRGAGSVLGERQHGQLAVVGYETYCRLLSEVVLEEQGGKMAPEKPPISIEFKVNAYISSDYIEDEEARFDLYQKIARVETEEDALEVTDELIDRYGDVPETVQNLLKISQIRSFAERCGFSAVIQKPQCFSFILGAGAVFMRNMEGREEAYQHFTKKYGRKMSLNAMSSPASIALFIDLTQSQSRILDEILEFLQDLGEVMG